MARPFKILITSVRAGAGHVKAAAARLFEMREKIARIAKPQAAFSIADEVAKTLAQ